MAVDDFRKRTVDISLGTNRYQLIILSKPVSDIAEEYEILLESPAAVACNLIIKEISAPNNQ
jgi:hypothetical protein